jgi:hypothetical protein
MRRLVVSVLLLAAAASVSAQELYNEQLLRTLGVDPDQIERILTMDQSSENDLRRLNADLDVKKAELARLLLDDEPNMRAVERNLNETAQIEVNIRLIEIRRELAIRDLVGTPQWARIMQAVRLRREEIALQQEMDRIRRESGPPEELEAVRAELQEQMTQVQEGMRRIVEEGQAFLSDPDLREQVQTAQAELQALMDEIRQAVRESAGRE